MSTREGTPVQPGPFFHPHGEEREARLEPGAPGGQMRGPPRGSRRAYGAFTMRLLKRRFLLEKISSAPRGSLAAEACTLRDVETLQILFLCSAEKGRFSVPATFRRASRAAPVRSGRRPPPEAARSGLDGREHDATLVVERDREARHRTPQPAASVTSCSSPSRMASDGEARKDSSAAILDRDCARRPAGLRSGRRDGLSGRTKRQGWTAPRPARCAIAFVRSKGAVSIGPSREPRHAS